MPLYDPHPKASPFPLNTLITWLLLQSSGTLPSLITKLHISATHRTPPSAAAFIISATTPDGPAALLFFILKIASRISVVVILSQGPLTTPPLEKFSPLQSN